MAVAEELMEPVAVAAVLLEDIHLQIILMVLVVPVAMDAMLPTEVAAVAVA